MQSPIFSRRVLRTDNVEARDLASYGTLVTRLTTRTSTLTELGTLLELGAFCLGTLAS